MTWHDLASCTGSLTMRDSACLSRCSCKAICVPFTSGHAGLYMFKHKFTQHATDKTNQQRIAVSQRVCEGLWLCQGDICTGYLTMSPHTAMEPGEQHPWLPTCSCAGWCLAGHLPQNAMWRSRFWTINCGDAGAPQPSSAIGLPGVAWGPAPARAWKRRSGHTALALYRLEGSLDRTDLTTAWQTPRMPSRKYQEIIHHDPIVFCKYCSNHIAAITSTEIIWSKVFDTF